MYPDYETNNTVVVIYPTNTKTWRKGAKPAQQTFVKLIKIISKYKNVLLIKNPGQDCPKLNKIKNMKTLELATNDSWARDILPIKVDKKYLSFKFNGYNGILNDYCLDDTLSQRFCQEQGLDFEKIDLTFEGGGIVSNDEVGIVTEECIFDRNPNETKQSIEKKLKEKLKLKYIIWLKKGLCYDETRGHADEIVAFKNSREILLFWTEDNENPNYQNCREVYNTLKSFFVQQNKNIIIHKVLTPKPFLRSKSDCIEGTFRNKQNLVAISYINYLDLNDAILLPQFHISRRDDRKAYQQFKKIFKGRKIIKFNSREFSLGGGCIHCVTRQY